MIGGGVPKNFAQDIVVAADILGTEAPMHKYAIQITVADVRDGALSSSTLKEASSWGKVDTTFEQMVYSEATLALPLITGYAFHKRHMPPARNAAGLACSSRSPPDRLIPHTHPTASRRGRFLLPGIAPCPAAGSVHFRYFVGTTSSHIMVIVKRLN